MNEIKERAIAKYCTHCGARTEYNCSGHATPCTRIKEYIAIATEQKAIDDDAIHAIVEEQVLKAIEKQKSIDEVERLSQVNQAYLDGRREKEEDMRMMLESQRKDLIGKAIRWICENIDDYARLGEDGAWVDHNVAADFKKAMEE